MVDVGSILIDDVHACLSLIRKQFTLTIGKDHAVYAGLLSLFASDLRALSDPTFRDRVQGLLRRHARALLGLAAAPS
jgi:hypothetical protein